MVDNYRSIAKVSRIVAVILILLAVAAIIFGIYKVAAYRFSYYTILGGTNCYVADTNDSDALNRVINGTYFTGWVTLGGALLVSGVILIALSCYANGRAEEQMYSK